MQQDASEFLSRLLAAVVRETNSRVGVQETPACRGNGTDDDRLLEEMWAELLRVNDSPFFSIFMGVRKTHLACNNCGALATLLVPIESVTLGLPGDRVMRDLVVIQWMPGKPAIRIRVSVSQPSRETYEQAVLGAIRLDNINAILFVDAATLVAVDPSEFSGDLFAFAVPFRDARYFIAKPTVDIHPFLCQVPPDSGIQEVADVLNATLRAVGLSLAQPPARVELTPNPIYLYLVGDPVPVSVTSSIQGCPIDIARMKAFELGHSCVVDDLQQYLNAFHGPTTNSERVCDVCTHHGCTETNFIAKFPPVVILHLLKTHSLTERKGDAPPVDYPETLDLTAIASTPSPTYRLFGVVDHIGQSVDRGHYIAHAYHHVLKQWLTFNDSFCLKCQSPHTRNAYVLFYERIDT
jgi:hypothetical protein